MSKYSRVDAHLQWLVKHGQQGLLKGGLIGIEKESLRVNSQGGISAKPHPRELGSALTHPHITTDYSEALIELITPPFVDKQESLDFLSRLHRYVYSRLEEEILWATSMPCVIDGDKHIPIAQYGSSNLGTMKTVYRRGLGYRYGKVMQVIAGVHFNYSLPEALWPVLQDHQQDSSDPRGFRSERYFALIRNLQRYAWLVPYLFGASPAVCKSFMQGSPTDMQSFDANTYYYPDATSLRMGDIGYTNSKENETGIKACYDSLDDYVSCLKHAIETPCAEYEKIGVKVDGVYRQLNANILQIENEYYSTVRPKQPPEGNEKPILALKRRGVQYIELRSLDVNAFHPLGIDEQQLYFLEALMVFCLLDDSPAIGAKERLAIDFNETATAHHGRDASLQLQRENDSISLQKWGLEIIDAMQGLCELMDEGEQGNPFCESLLQQKEKLLDPAQTPSAIMLSEMRESNENFYQFAKRMSQQHYAYFRNQPLSGNSFAECQQQAEASLHAQTAIESSETQGFDEFLQDYFAQQ